MSFEMQSGNLWFANSGMRKLCAWQSHQFLTVSKISLTPVFLILQNDEKQLWLRVINEYRNCLLKRTLNSTKDSSENSLINLITKMGKCLAKESVICEYVLVLSEI